MEVLIIFGIAWVLSRAWDARVEEYRAAEKETRKNVNRRHPNASKPRREQMVRNAARRRSAGYWAYQVRHGWPGLRTAVSDGWDDAKKGHQEWLKDHPKTEGGPSRWARWRSAWTVAWKGAKRKFVDEAEEIGPGAEPVPVPPRPAPQPRPTPNPSPEPTPIRSVPDWKPTGHSPIPNGGTMSGEAGGYAAAQHVTDGYNQSLGAASDQLEQYEADLIAGGLENDPAAMATLTEAREGLDKARAAFGGHKAALTDHEQGHEYAVDKGAAAAKTEWLADGA